MNHQNISRRCLCSLLVAWACLAVAATAELPRSSVYQLDLALVDQDGRTSQWRDAAAQSGGPRIVSMFYSRCDYVCPMLFEAIKNVEAQLPADVRKRLQIGLITVDPARDDVVALKKLAGQRAGDAARWHLYRTQATDVRKIAGVLGIQYRALNNGEFSHSTVMILLDHQGVELARTDNIAKPDPSFLKAVVKAAAP
jgi:protein SCO1